MHVRPKTTVTKNSTSKVQQRLGVILSVCLPVCLSLFLALSVFVCQLSLSLSFSLSLSLFVFHNLAYFETMGVWKILL